MDEPPPDLRRWARAWDVAKTYLERERAERLRTMTDDAVRATVATHSPGQVAAATQLQKMLTAAGYDFCFVGSLAVQRWGDPRHGPQIDVMLLCPFGEEADTTTRLSSLLDSRVKEPLPFASQARYFVAQLGGVPIDIAFGAIELDVHRLERASAFDFGDGRNLTTCSAEDLIIMKAFVGRPRDWIDIEGVILRGRKIDWALVERELNVLLQVKEAPQQTMQKLVGMRQKPIA